MVDSSAFGLPVLIVDVIEFERDYALRGAHYMDGCASLRRTAAPRIIAGFAMTRLASTTRVDK